MIFGIFFRFQYSCVLLSPCTDIAHLFGTLPGNRHYPNPPGGGGTRLQEPNGHVPLDGVAFSRLE